METTTINRKLTNQAGLPQNDMLLADGKVKYDAQKKTWTCAICNNTKHKYNRKQIINRVNSTHGENRQNIPNRKGKGKLIERDNYIICNMERDYGGIRTECEFPNETNDFVKHYVCETCNKKLNEIDGIKRHLARSHRQMKKVEDLDCPKCEGNFAHLGTLNRHIYIDKTCKKLTTCLKPLTGKKYSQKCV